MSNKDYLFGAFKNIFNNDEDDVDIDDVENYFNNLNDNNCPVLPLPVETVNYKIGQLIHIKGGDNTIYLINNIQDNNNINIVSTIDNKNNKNITQNEILNIININPDTLFIDRDYLIKIEETDPNTFDNTDKLLLKIKYYKSKIAISKIKLKIFAKNDSLIELDNETINISTYEHALETALEELTNIPNKESMTDDKYIAYIKNRFRQFYGINNINNAINLLNNVLSTFGITEIDKDKILNKYILLCDRISFVSIISIPLVYRFKIIRSCIACFCNFVKTIISNDFVIINIILPLTTYYLYTNMDTAYLVVKNGTGFIRNILSSILCQISTLFYEKEEEQDDASQSSNTTNTSNKTLITIYSHSTFPSLSSIKSLNDLYNKTDVINNDAHNENIGAIITTQNNSVLESPQDSQTSTIASQNSDGRIGGKIKNTRITKKHKRITIRRSKRSKKMKGGKRTRSTKKRHVGRRRKHNTKKY
jgi:hypothetical protein